MNRHKECVASLAVLAAGVILLSACGSAAAGFVRIEVPDDAYKADTTKIEVAAGQFDLLSISDGTLTVGFSTPRSTGNIGIQWGTWSSPLEAESADPVVFYTPFLNGSTLPAASIEVLSFDKDLATFGIEVENNDARPPHDVTADFYDRNGDLVGSITQSIGGDSGARLFAATATDGDSFAKVIVTRAYEPGDDSFKDFAFAQVRYAVAADQIVPAPSSLVMLLGMSAVGVVASFVRRRRSASSG
jgi:hypothetical protein